MSSVAIVNPKAGGGRGAQLPATAQVLETKAPGHAIELTRQAIERGARKVIAVGGDGTINEVVNGFFENEQLIAADAALGIIPHGTGSDFSRILNRVMGSGDMRMVDLMKVRYTTSNGTSRVRYSINVTSFGMGGEVAARVNRSRKPLGGRIAFLAESKEAVLIEIDGEPLGRLPIEVSIVLQAIRVWMP